MLPIFVGKVPNPVFLGFIYWALLEMLLYLSLMKNFGMNNLVALFVLQFYSYPNYVSGCLGGLEPTKRI